MLKWHRIGYMGLYKLYYQVIFNFLLFNMQTRKFKFLHAEGGIVMHK